MNIFTTYLNFYTRENEYSEELKDEPNPTLYIGTF